MSKTTPTASSPSSNIDAMMEESLRVYETDTNKSLRPLMDELKGKSTADILAAFRTQVKEFKEFASEDKLMESLNPIVNVLSVSSSVIGAGVALVFSPASVIFAGVDVLLSAAKGVIESHDALLEIFERIGNFFNRLEKHTEKATMEAIKDIIVETMVEVLKIFAYMTKEVNRGRVERFIKNLSRNLIGSDVIKGALSKLDRLTQEEGNRLIGHTSNTADRIEGDVGAARGELKVVGDEVKGVSDDLKQHIKDGKEKEAREDEEKQRQKIEETRRRVREDRKWLSAPDPSANQAQNIASHARRNGSANWFFQGNISMEWKSESTTSFKLLWLHGKPGSGKSVLCSALIKDITALKQTRRATVAYFYFDFKDTNKQNVRNALRSILTQLSACSDSYCDVLSRVYKEHDHGTYQPDTENMVECLKEMLTLSDQLPVYIILDALDECPQTSGDPPARQEVLDLLTDLVGLRLSTLHICVTSRPEVDIKSVLEPLAFHAISIHDQNGQKKDIEEYIKSVVYAKSVTAMSRWRPQDKELVMETLTEKADGMFRWVFCQLEVLRRCLPQNIRRTLNALPESLDETYERVLKEIGMANGDLAHRLLQCLTMAIRPLRVEELAEILAFDFEEAKGSIPKLNKDCRSENPQEDVLSTCSSLIAVVGYGYSQVIQFSHFSVKEFLTSDRLSSSKGDASHLHIMAEPAHTTLAQACLGTLLQFDGTLDDNQVEHSFPLATYASWHWVKHAQFGTVSSRIEDGMRRLFDSAKPHFSAWIKLHDMDETWHYFGTDETKPGTPLYYTSLFGFRHLAASIIVEHPEQVNATGGHNHSPLAAALHKKHFEVVELLHQHGAVVDIPGDQDRTPLCAASKDGTIDVVRWLLSHGADAEWQDYRHQTPVMLAAKSGRLEVVQMLLGHGVRINAVDETGLSALHKVSLTSHAIDHGLEIARLLLDHGADVEAEDNGRSTPLQRASRGGKPDIVRLLLERGANVNAEDNDGRTPLHEASSEGTSDTVRLLLERGANVNAEDNDGRTPLHQASSGWDPHIGRLLLERGANVNAEDKNGRTPLHQASSEGGSDIVRLLLELGANVNAENKSRRTPLHEASSRGERDIVRLLLERGANVNAEDNHGRTPLHQASSGWEQDTVRLLLERGANVNAEDSHGRTPLHRASSEGTSDIVRLLLERGANGNAEDNNGRTPLHRASSGDKPETVRLLLDYGACVDAKDKEGRTPLQVLHLVSGWRKNNTEIVLRMLTEHGAQVDGSL